MSPRISKKASVTSKIEEPVVPLDTPATPETVDLSAFVGKPPSQDEPSEPVVPPVDLETLSNPVPPAAPSMAAPMQSSRPAAIPVRSNRPPMRPRMGNFASGVRPTVRPLQGGSPRYQPMDQGSDQGGRYQGGYGGGGFAQAGGYQRDGGYRQNRYHRDNGGQMQDANVPTEQVTGYLDIQTEGHGFLRPKYIASDKDIYISQSQIRKFMLRAGDEVIGQARAPKENERYYGLLKVEKVNGLDAEVAATRPKFDDLTPIYPKDQIKLEQGKEPISCRIIDLFAPIGFGQRGLIVSPPKAGKTTILKQLASGITANFPNAVLMALLIGERPEEVTDLSRSIKGIVIASHFDQSPNEQTKVAEIGLDRAKRLVESGKDVVILLDSITRLARAYNLTVNSSGRTLSGGFDPAALYPAKKFLGAARKTEDGGSLTIIGTALVDTGSRMDDLIYEEFKGTGNMELHLNRGLAEKRIFPAIDIEKSGTRQEELLFTEERLKKIVTLRNMLALLGDSAERTQALIQQLSKTDTNEDFIATLSKAM